MIEPTATDDVEGGDGGPVGEVDDDSVSAVVVDVGGKFSVEGGGDVPYVVVHVADVFEGKGGCDDAAHPAMLYTKGERVRGVHRGRRKEGITGLVFDPYKTLADNTLDERGEYGRVRVVECVLVVVVVSTRTDGWASKADLCVDVANSDGICGHQRVGMLAGTRQATRSDEESKE